MGGGASKDKNSKTSPKTASNGENDAKSVENDAKSVEKSPQTCDSSAKSAHNRENAAPDAEKTPESAKNGPKPSKNASKTRENGAKDPISTAFSRIDADGSGFVDANELHLLMTELGNNYGWDEDKSAEALAAMDFDGDGRVSLAEFRRFWGEFCDLFSAIFGFFRLKTRFLEEK
jgi:hypothetical protein